MYNIELLYYKTEFRGGTESYSEAFDIDDPTLPYRYPTYDTDKDLDDRPPTPTKQQVRFKRKTSKKQTEYWKTWNDFDWFKW